MNYNTVESIFSAGTTNMTSVFHGEYGTSDDMFYIKAPAWMAYNDQKIDSIACERSWYQFFSSVEGFSDTNNAGSWWRMYIGCRGETRTSDCYVEEGTLYNYYKFLKIKWEGYVERGSYALKYDLIFWSTGHVSLKFYIINSRYQGTYQARYKNVYKDFKPYTSKPLTIAFTDNGPEFEEKLFSPPIPEEIRYLIKDEEVLYSYSEEELIKLNSTEVNKAIFLQHGKTKLPRVEILEGLKNPQLLMWTDKTDFELYFGLQVTGEPKKKFFYYDPIELPEGWIFKDMMLIGDLSTTTLYQVSFDEGTTWKFYNGHEWLEGTDSNGMSWTMMVAIYPEEWEQIASSNACQIRAKFLYDSDSIGPEICYNLIEKNNEI